MAFSCAVVRLAGALVVELVAYVTASLPIATNTMPPGPFAGSVEARPRDERAKSVQKCFPSLVFALAVRLRMPALEPSGRGIAVRPDLSLMLSPIAPVFGFSASQLYRCVPVECDLL